MRTVKSSISNSAEVVEGQLLEQSLTHTYEALRAANHRKLTAKPNSKAQHRFITDFDTHSLAAIGGIGSGKTWSLMQWAVQMMQRNANTGSVGGIFANTYQQLTQATLPRLWDVFDAIGFVDGIDYVYNRRPPWPEFKSRFKKHDNVLCVRQWGEVIIRSLDDPKATRGIELGWAAMDELRDMRHEAFTTIQGRVRCKKSNGNYIRGSTSPNGYDWVYDEFIDNPKKVRGRDAVHMRTIDNAANLAPGYYEQLRDSYDTRLAAQELDGQIVSLAAGLVYHAFDRTKNMIGTLPHRSLPIHISFDFNRTPFSVVIAQVHQIGNSPDTHKLHVVDEVSMTDASTDAVCREVFNRVKPYTNEQTEFYVYGDAAGTHKSTTSNRSDYDIITMEFKSQYSHRFVPRWRISNPSVIGSVNAVNAMLCNSKGLRRLYLSPKCVQLRKDFERVQFIQGSKEICKKDKTLTHMSDALRYMVNELFPVRRSVGGVLHT